MTILFLAAKLIFANRLGALRDRFNSGDRRLIYDILDMLGL
jgi:hypothetical protein